MEAGRVVVTVEKVNPKWEHTWVQRLYAGLEGQPIYRTHVNVIPFEQHKRFKLIDEV